ncbi:MAG: phosphoenolpyruvate carboxykinase (ATP) [Candidatus Riflebacteria bacterium HGW-Riflebacteria-2]|jgi:phosphoenolpyruvate carboxykinase (ATP)|nr:MAG: phosphoenolpyruvate carboxykinase (ATP) [Candidatus Riflebacteria bacterium HGW-Riflebacteria-2]
MTEQTCLNYLGVTGCHNIYLNRPVAELVERAIVAGEGRLASNGALLVDRNNGERFGRSPNDRFIVKTPGTEDVWWSDINRPIEQENWQKVFKIARDYLKNRDVYVFDGFAGAAPEYRLQVRVVAEKAWHALFSETLFVNSKNPAELKEIPDFTVLAVPDMRIPEWKSMGLKSEVAILVNFSEKIVLIAGSHYGGEIKKSIFSVLNYLMPKRGVFSMHCSANISQNGETALFFGLSGTGKTTLSADPERRLIGDDEHGWHDHGVFNFEGGCYAKCIKLSQEAEPQIFNAIRFGSILENVVVDEHRVPDFDSDAITENTRATYPTQHIDNCVQEGVGGHPKNVFFLAADAFGVLPPIARLSPEQAMYHFLSGYTAKLAGTESGITEPTATFSACFGEPFMVLHPFTYAKMLGECMKKHGTKLWLVNTGWSGGSYGTGSRMKIKYTRALLRAALDGQLDKVEFKKDPIFAVEVPSECPGVPAEILTPVNTWKDKAEFIKTANDLAARFNVNFKKYASQSSPEVCNAGPVVRAEATA